MANLVMGSYSSVLGGEFNHVNSDYSAIVGGFGNNLRLNCSFGMTGASLTCTITRSNCCGPAAPNTRANLAAAAEELSAVLRLNTLSEP